MKILFTFLSRLPLSVLHFVGAGLGLFVYFLSQTYRQHLVENLKIAGFSADLRFEVARETGKQMLEVAKIWQKDLQKTQKMIVALQNEEILKKAEENPNGILFITPHLGAFELTAQWYAARRNITVLYRAPKNKTLESLVLQGRSREKLHLAPADLSGVKKLLKALKKGEAIGILPDQTPKAGEGVWVNFFNQPAYTMTLAAKLSQSKASVVYAVAERLPQSAGFKLCFYAPQQKLNGSIECRAQMINHDIEMLIATCPAQYLWGYNRFKRS